MKTEHKYPHISVTKGLAGWFAVVVWWNPEGFAEELGIPFYPPTPDHLPARQDVENQIRELIPGVEVIKLTKE